MPRVLRIPKALRTGPPISDGVFAWLCDEVESTLTDQTREAWDIFQLKGDYGRRVVHEGTTRFERIVTENLAEIIEHFIALHPGRRPRCWWQWCAPQLDLFPDLFLKAERRPLFAEPRLRLGGKGVTPWECGLAVVPQFEYGIPACWQLDDWIWTGFKKQRPPVSYVPFDPADPPLFESQAAYLKRHDLLLPGEAKLLRRADFAPEASD